MKLITKAIAKKLPQIGATGELESSEVKVHLKLFDCWGAFTWYVTEYDPEEGLMFGFVDSGNPYDSELGYFNLNEIKKALGWRLERDMYYSSETLEEVMTRVKGR